MKNRTPVIEVINVPGWTQPSFNKLHLLTRLLLRVKSAFWRSKSFLNVFFYIKKTKAVFFTKFTNYDIKISNSPSSRTLTILKIKKKKASDFKKKKFKKTARYLKNFRITCESCLELSWPHVTLQSISSFMGALP